MYILKKIKKMRVVKIQMAIKNYECLNLPWDTDYFGIRSARVNLRGIVNYEGQKAIEDFCKNFSFITIYNFDNTIENNYWLGTRTNAFLVDVNIQFSKDLTYKPKFQDENSYTVNDLIRNEQIIEIAKKSFNYSRFFNDPNLLQTKAESIYLKWTESAFEKKDKYFVISKRDDNIAGYILFKIIEDTSVIELIAVDEKYQGQSVGKSLILTMEAFVLGQGIKNIKVGTQVNNVQATRFYNAMGFKYETCSSIYHLWDGSRENIE